MLVINHLAFLGFAINREKSSPLPSRQTVYLGLCLDSATMTAMLSPPRRDAILSALSRFFSPSQKHSSGGLLANGWSPGDTSSGCSSFPVRCRQTWNIGKDPPPFSGVFPWAGWRPIVVFTDA
ncbi:unnamed protein product [Boreogadus saida]